MKDENGLYYYPFPDNKRVRMYVQDNDGVICFRMWSADDAELWKSHGWMPYRAILEASQMSTRKHFDPKQAYDVRVARELLQHNRINQTNSDKVMAEVMDETLGSTISTTGTRKLQDISRNSLKYIVTKFGISICEDARRCEAMLRDLCPECKKEIHVLVNAIRENIPQELIRVPKTTPRELLMVELSKRLCDNLGITDDLAQWVVESWAALIDLEKSKLFSV